MAEHELSTSAQRVQNTLNALGIALKVIELPASTRTAKDAADAVGCDVGQIAKSLVFEMSVSHRPILIIASGKNRVNEKLMKTIVGEKIKKAHAEFVRSQTGFSIGGVSPVGHTKKIPIYIDRDLFNYKEIWAAAGTPHALFCLTPDDLLKITSGKIVAIH